MLLNLLKSDRDCVKLMFVVLNALLITTMMDANLAQLLDMTQQSKLGCWKNGLLHTLIKRGKVSF
jgi:hypothetical protein